MSGRRSRTRGGGGRRSLQSNHPLLPRTLRGTKLVATSTTSPLERRTGEPTLQKPGEEELALV